MPHTSLSFVAPGAEWPPTDTETAERLARYEVNRLLFDGKADEVFDTWIKVVRQDDAASLEIILNWNRRLSTLWPDLTFGETPRISVDNGQDKLNAFVERNELWNVCAENGLNCSMLGSGVFKYGMREGLSFVENSRPDVVFPIVRPDNVKVVDKYVLAWTYKDDEDEDVEWLKVEIHSRGHIERHLYVIENGAIADEAAITEAEHEDTGLDDFLLRVVHNVSTSDRFWGRDDYADLDGILQDIMVRLDQRARILDKHADPNMVVPESALETDEDGELHYRAHGKAIVEDGDSKNTTRYVTWDGQLQAVDQQITDLERHLYVVSETTPAIFSQSDQGYAQSGTALRMRTIPVLTKVRRLRMRYDPALKSIIRNCMALEGVDVGGINIAWMDGLPDDELERAQIEQTRISSHNTSVRSSVRRCDNLEGKQLDDEIAAIKSDGDVPAPEVTLPEVV